MTQREPQHQTGGTGVNKAAGGSCRINVGANAEVAGDEIIEPYAGPEFDILPDSETRQMLGGIIPQRSRSKNIQGKFVGAVEVGSVLLPRFVVPAFQSPGCFRGEQQDHSADKHLLFRKHIHWLQATPRGVIDRGV